MTVSVNPITAGTYQAGIIPIITRNGTVASPLVTQTGNTGAAFTLPVTPTIAPGMLGPQSRLRIQVISQRTGANGTANLDVYLGTAGTTSDSRVIRSAYAATTLQIIQIDTAVQFGTSTTTGMSTGKQNTNSAGTDNQFGDLSTNLNTAATMYVTVATNTANTLDSFSIISYKVWIEP